MTFTEGTDTLTTDQPDAIQRPDPTATPLRDHVRASLSRYLEHMDGHEITDLYDLVIREVEAPMLELVLGQVNGNQSAAARILGMSRSTLRKKLQIHDLS